MALESKHPLYSARLPDWQQMRTTHAGERAVKAEGQTYLPATAGMVRDGVDTPGTKGDRAYRAYKGRARYPGWVAEAVRALVGAMHRKPAVIELPPQLEPLRDRATNRGESLAVLLQKINEEQFVTGRVGILADVIDKGPRAGQFYLTQYAAERITNWDEARNPTDLATRDEENESDDVEVDALNLVVLDETGPERTDSFEWELVRRYRVCVLGPADTNENEDDVGAIYRVGVFEERDDFNEEALLTPSVSGRTATEIPFVFINAVDIVTEPGAPPLLDLSNLSLTYYRGQADYRQSLFMQGQDTLVLIGSPYNEDQELPTGAGARIDLPLQADAKYVGVDSAGIPEQREALANDQREALQLAGQLLETDGQQESGAALRVRVAARKATVVQVAIAGAFGLQEVLRKLARWIGADPEAVVVTPNLDFADQSMTGKELAELMGAKTQGAPIALATIHDLMAQRGLTSKTFDEEIETIEGERELELAPVGTDDPNGPGNDPNADPDADPDADPEDTPAPADA